MRISLAHVTSIFMLFALQTEASAAPVICSLIAKYFADPPSGFISERGENISTGRWRSNQSFQNSSCYIGESRRGTHRIGCVINSKAPLSVVADFGKRVENDIDECLTLIPEGGNYDKEDTTEDSDGVVSHTVTWTYEGPDAIYTISLSANRDDDGGHPYNYISLEWSPN